MVDSQPRRIMRGSEDLGREDFVSNRGGLLSTNWGLMLLGWLVIRPRRWKYGQSSWLHTL